MAATVQQWVDDIYKRMSKFKMSQEKKENLIKELVTCENWEQVQDIKYRYKIGTFKKEDDKWFNERAKNKITCPCGCRVIIPEKVDRIICRWCNKWVYKDEKTEFKYKLLEEKKRAERGD